MNRWTILVFLGSSFVAAATDAQEVQLNSVAPQPTLINDVDAATVALHPVTPFVEPSTCAVIDLDLRKVNVEGIASWSFDLFDVDRSDPQAEQGIAMVAGFFQSLRGAGVDKLYVSLSTRSWFDGGPLVIVPCDDVGPVNGLAALALQGLPNDPPTKIEVQEKLLLAGPESVVDRVQAGDGVERSDLVLPLKDPDRLDHMIVFSLPEESRRELIAIWPERGPEDFPIDFSPRQLVADIDQFVFTWNLPPNPKVRLIIKAPDPAAAMRLKTLADEIARLYPETSRTLSIETNLSDVVIEVPPESLVEVIAMNVAAARQSSRQMQLSNDMKQIGLAIHNYHSKHKHFPPRCFVDPNGKPLLSGRVAILPHLEQEELYETFRLDQSWDSDQNRQLIDATVMTYITGMPADKSDHTRLRFPVYPGSLWQGDEPPRRMKDVQDGLSTTIAVIHAPEDAAVAWSDPKPWVLSEEDPMSDVFGDRDQATVLFGDGSVRVLRRGEMRNKKLKAMLTIDGGESIDF